MRDVEGGALLPLEILLLSIRRRLIMGWDGKDLVMRSPLISSLSYKIHPGDDNPSSLYPSVKPSTVECFW